MIYQRYFIQIETTQIRSQGISEPICECQRVSRRVVSNLGWEIIFELVWFCRMQVLYRPCGNPALQCHHAISIGKDCDCALGAGRSGLRKTCRET